MARKRRKTKAYGFKLIMLLLFVLCAVAVGKQEYQIYQINQERTATEERIAVLQQQQAELQAERKRLDDPRYIEKLAREDYNMVGKDEVPLFIVDEKQTAGK